MTEATSLSKTGTIIGIAGASGAGKSRFAELLYQRIRSEHSQHDVTILNEDAYYRDRSDLNYDERCQINYDHPDALEHNLLAQHLNSLRNGQTIQVPQYDYTQHNRKPQPIEFQPSKIVIVEGILLLSDSSLREQLDLRIFVDVDLDVCLARRLRRDIQERGRTLDSVLEQYETFVRPMFFKFIDPSKQFADLIVPRGGENQNALNVLHSHLKRLLSR